MMSDIKWKQRLSYVTIALFFFMGGVEYAVILPTLWLYIHTDFGAEEYFLGLLLSAYSFAAIISGPILGRWTDKSRHPKFIIIFGVLWEVAGSVMYFMGISVWFLLGSRLVCGVGGGVEAVVIAEVTRTTEEDKRTGIISILVAIRQTGLLIGPGLNLFLREVDFTVASFHVNKYNVPGAFMAIMWTLQILVVLFCFTDLHRLKEAKASEVLDESTNSLRKAVVPESQTVSPARLQPDEDQYRQLKPENQSVRAVIQEGACDPDDLIETAENVIAGTLSKPLSSSYDENGFVTIEADDEGLESSLKLIQDEKLARTASQEYINSNEEALVDYLAGRSKLRFMYDEYIREEVVTVIAVQFNSYFNQLALETMVTPLTLSLLDWGELENSVLYCCAGVEVIVVFMFVRWLSKRVADRTLISVGAITMTAGLAWLIYAIPRSHPHSPKENIPKLLVGVFLDMCALPFLVAGSVSLYSKITRKETQGLSMGLRRSVVGMALILAPLWAGGTIQMPYVMFGVMIGLLGLSLIMLCLSYGKLKPKDSDKQRPVPSTATMPTDEERKPLLS